MHSLRLPLPRLSPLGVVLAGGAILLVAGAAAEIVGLRSTHHELLDSARELRIEGAQLDRLDRAIAQAGDRDRARLALARALLAAEVDRPGSEPPGALSDLGRERLETARDLASDTLAAHPASWRAATVVGTATYLLWSRDRDPRLVREYRRWEAPLLLARRLAPGRDEPVRALVPPYLELWSVLSEDKRELAGELVARALRHRPTFDRLVEPWLAVAGTGPDALATIPDRPWAWDRLTSIFAARGDWRGTCDAWERGRSALEDDLRRRLAVGRDLLGRGQILAARSELFGLVGAAPPDHRYAPVVEQALEAVPPGPGPTDLAPTLRAWLRWALASEGAPADERLSERALARLRSTAFPRGIEDTDLPLAARAALAVDGARSDGLDRLHRAERLERAADDLWSPDWGLYFIDKARSAAASGSPRIARRALERVHPDLRDHPLYRLARVAVAEASRNGDTAAARDALARRAARLWKATSWSREGTVSVLYALAAGPAAGLRIELPVVPPDGAAVEIRLDGTGLGCRAVDPGDTLSVDHPLAPGLHRLELRTLAARDGDRVWPGAVILRGGL